MINSTFSNSMMFEVVKEMEEFSKDSQLLLKEHVVVLGGITVQDDVYKELFKEMDDEEFG